MTKIRHVTQLCTLHICVGLFLTTLGCHKKFYADWICDYNNENKTSFNATYDCRYFNFDQKKAAKIKMRDMIKNNWTENMSSLTIQNCNTLTLDIQWNIRDAVFIELRYLNIVNISELIILPFNTVDYSCLPQYVLFENIKMSRLKFPIISPHCLSFDGFKSLELRNVSVKEKIHDVSPYTNLIKLVLDKVKIESAGFQSFEMKNKNGSVKITNSYFDNVAGNFLDFSVSNFTFSGNVIQNVTPDAEYPIFDLKADEVNICHNMIGEFSNQTMKLISNNIKITNNVFERVNQNVLEEIISMKSHPNFSLDFSNNVIYFLTPKLFRMRNEGYKGNVLFVNATISNNSINCVCENMLWFESVVRNQGFIFPNFLTYKWARKGNRNKCLNIPDCGVSQVLRNYHDLCENKYECPEEIISDERVKRQFEALISDEKLNDISDCIQKVYNCCVFLIFFVCGIRLIWAIVRIKNYLIVDPILNIWRNIFY